MNNFFKRYENGDRPLGSRLATMKIALSLLDKNSPKNFVETGTTRKTIYTHPNVEDRAADGSSTLIFGDFASKHGGHVWTCDIESQNIENCKIATKEYQNLITYIADDSINFLDKFNDRIDFLYLDSLDSDYPNAHEHQLKEIQSAFSKIHKKSIILLDDLGGKTKLSTQFLQENNWCQILINIPRPMKHNNFMQGLFVHEEFLYTNHSLIPIEKRYKDM